MPPIMRLCGCAIHISWRTDALPFTVVMLMLGSLTPRGDAAPASSPATVTDDLELAALDDARVRMRQAIARQRVTREFRVDELLSARGAPLERIDELLEECTRAGPLRNYRDGTCEVYLLLSEGKLTAALRRWLGDGDGPMRFDSSANEPILVSGCAAPRLRDPTRAPIGWAPLPPEARELAEAAARLDARLALVERLRRLRVGADATVSDLIGERPALGWALSETDWKLTFSAARFTPDVRCFVRAEMSLGEVERGLREALRGSGHALTEDAISSDTLLRLNGVAALSAMGVGAPPADLLIEFGAAAPAWASNFLTVVGEAVAGDTNQSATQMHEKAESEARADATARLLKAAQRLELSRGLTLESLVQSHAELKADVDEFLRGAVELRPAAMGADGRVSVTLAIPVRRLWRLARPLVSAPDKGGEERP